MTGSGAPHSYGPANGAGGHPYPSQHTFDQTGQIAPPGMKPRVTATLWEDEGSLCFQVEAKGVCVARREGTFERRILEVQADTLFQIITSSMGPSF